MYTNINGSKYLSKIDFKDAYLKMVINIIIKINTNVYYGVSRKYTSKFQNYTLSELYSWHTGDSSKKSL